MAKSVAAWRLASQVRAEALRRIASERVSRGADTPSADATASSASVALPPFAISVIRRLRCGEGRPSASP